MTHWKRDADALGIDTGEVPSAASTAALVLRRYIERPWYSAMNGREEALASLAALMADREELRTALQKVVFTAPYDGDAYRIAQEALRRG